MAKVRLSIKGLLLASAALLFSGCTTVYKPLGWVISSYSKDEVVPYAMAHPDADVSVCGTGQGLTQLVGSFGRVVKDPNYTLFYTELLTGFCAENKAYEANLRYLRAEQQDQITIARDELMLAKRWHAIAAERRVRAVDFVTARYGDIGNETCPNLFKESDEITYMLGLVTALQAVRSDLLSGAQVGVNRDLAARTMRSSHCLDNEKWWGTPQAIRSTVWAFVPGTLPDNKDLWQNYQAADEIAKQHDALFPLVLHAIGADNQGKDAQVRKALKLAGDVQQRLNSDEHQFPAIYQLVNAISHDQLRQMSDAIWMEQKGHRSPPNSLDKFPDEAQRAPADIDGLL
ncbi:hypothetical protein [Alcanivorax sp.]|jgi:hypothetical protein|uniref:hypothetical protein n=1 Tax=Alcanivorax sp. TaxID=1872427 RepID=UPI003A8CE57B